MNTRLLGLIQIILGCAILLIFAGDLLFKLVFVAAGLYLIFTGLKLRNLDTVIFRHIRFGNRPWPF